jgi:hypothetical protein
MNSQWPNLFDTYFLSSSTRLTQTATTTSDDDLVFYVTRQMENDFHHPLVIENYLLNSKNF